MARPRAKELTQRELEIMHIFWDRGESTAADIRDALDEKGRELALTTVATLVRILLDKHFLTQTGFERPFRFEPARTFEEVSRSILGELVEKVFGGSRSRLLVQLLGDEKLTPMERQRLQEILGSREQKAKGSK